MKKKKLRRNFKSKFLFCILKLILANIKYFEIEKQKGELK